MPKYIVNASGDQFFLPDSSQFYFDDLPGEKHLRYVPNGDHGMGGTDAAQGLHAFYEAVLNDVRRPEYEWDKRYDGSLHVLTKQTPSEVNLWQASNPEGRDFRVEKIGRVWTSTTLEARGPGEYLARVQKPARGFTAFFVELIFDSGGKYPFKFTTEVSVIPDIEPFKDQLAGQIGN